MKPRIKMRCMPGDISKGAKINMLEGKDPRKAVSKAFKDEIKTRERATLKRRTEKEIERESESCSDQKCEEPLYGCPPTSCSRNAVTIVQGRNFCRQHATIHQEALRRRKEAPIREEQDDQEYLQRMMLRGWLKRLLSEEWQHAALDRYLFRDIRTLHGLLAMRMLVAAEGRHNG